MIMIILQIYTEIYITDILKSTYVDLYMTTIYAYFSIVIFSSNNIFHRII